MNFSAKVTSGAPAAVVVSAEGGAEVAWTTDNSMNKTITSVVDKVIADAVKSSKKTADAEQGILAGDDSLIR